MTMMEPTYCKKNEGIILQTGLEHGASRISIECSFSRIEIDYHTLPACQGVLSNFIFGCMSYSDLFSDAHWPVPSRYFA
jgi:hypothetical protein